MRINLSPGFSRTVVDAPNSSRGEKLYQPDVALSPGKPIPGPLGKAVKKKRELFTGPTPASPGSFVLPHTIHVLVPEY